MCIAQTHEKQKETHYELAMEIGHLLLSLGEPEQALAYFNPTPQNLDPDTRFKLHAASGQLRYHQWLQAWDATPSTSLEGLTALQKGDAHVCVT